MEATLDSMQLTLTVIISVLMLLVMVAMVVLLLVGSHNRRNKHRAELMEVRARHAEEVRTVEREVLTGSLAEVARELHDNIGQRVMTARLAVEPLRLQEATRERAGTALEIIAELTDEVRRVSRSLNAEKLVERPLAECIGTECERLDQFGKVKVIWHPPPEAVELPPDHTLILFRLFQESVHNVLKHANARTVEVRVAGTPRPVLEVRDDGKGFDPAHVANSGQGLRNLDRRARMIGYYCDVISAPGKGTLIRIHP